MSVGRRRRRFLFDVFFVRMWLLKALILLSFPEPVILNRFLAPLCAFIFGIAIFLYFDRACARIMISVVPLTTSRIPLFRRENHRHELPFELRVRLDLGDIG